MSNGSPAAGAPAPYPSFRLKVILNTVVVVVVGIVLQQTLMDFADGMAYRAFDFIAFLRNFAGLLLHAVVAPVVVGTILVWAYVNPLHKVLWTIYSGGRPSERAYHRALRILVYYPYLLIVLNVVGFASGYLLGTPKEQLETPQGVVQLLQNIAGGIVFALVQVSINNLALAKPRELLRIHYLGPLREPSNARRGMLVTVSLALYVMFTVISVGQSINNATQLSANLYRAVASGTKSLADATADYRAAVAKIREIPASSVRPPAEDAGAVQPVFVYLAIVLFLVVLAVFMQLMASRSQKAQFDALTAKLGELSAGKADLTQRVLIAQFDELGELSQAINRFISKLKELLGQFVDAGEGVTRSSATLRGVLDNTAAATEQMVASIAQISSNAGSQASVVRKTEGALSTMLDSLDRISTNVDAQAAFVEETSSAITEMAANIRAVSEATTKANALAANLIQVAKDGAVAVDNSAKAVRDLEQSSEQVNAIVTVIAKIAAQTNLLAMNAAIEAAHAGDAGRGFAVVAEEVRSLAENSAASAKEIAAHIKSMSSLIDTGVRLSGQAGESLKRIGQDINNTTSLIEQIAGAMKEQSVGANEIVTGMSSLVRATQEIRRIAEEQKSSNAAMRSSIETLVQIITEIQEATEEQAKGNHEIVDGIANLQNVESDNRQIVDRLQALLSRFVLTGEEEPVFSKVETASVVEET